MATLAPCTPPNLGGLQREDSGSWPIRKGGPQTLLVPDTLSKESLANTGGEVEGKEPNSRSLA